MKRRAYHAGLDLVVVREMTDWKLAEQYEEVVEGAELVSADDSMTVCNVCMKCLKENNGFPRWNLRFLGRTK